MKLSVVVPAFNGAQTISHQLDALQRQQTKFMDWEVIVADNGSTDDTALIVKKYAISYPVPLKVVDASHRQGASHARNVGAIAAQGEVLAFCDCDDYVAHTWVQAAWDGIQSGADILGGEIRSTFIKDKNPEDFSWEPTDFGGVRSTTFGFGVTSGNLVFRKEAYLKIGGFNESLPPYGGEDSEISFRASRNGLRAQTQPELILYFSPTRDSKTLLKKVFQAGVSQSLIWHLHQEHFGNHWKVTSGIREFAKWMVATPKNLKTGSVKTVLRGYAVRAGSLYGNIYYAIHGWPEPRLLEAK